MAKEDDEFSYESLQDRESIGKYLNALAAGFADGTVSFQSGDRNLVLEPKGLLKFKLEVDAKDERAKIVLKISWKRPKERRGGSEPLIIDSADRPAGGGAPTDKDTGKEVKGPPPTP